MHSIIQRHITEKQCPGCRRATRGGIFPPEIFKALHSNFDICRNFQRIKMKFYILIIVKKFYWNFSLSCSLIIFLQDLACDRLSDRKFRKWLVFNDKYAGSVNFRDSLNCSEFFIYLFVYYFFLDRPQFALMKLYNIRAVFFNRGSAEPLGFASGCQGFRRNRPKLPGTKFATLVRCVVTI